MHEAERGLFDFRQGRLLYVRTSCGNAPDAGVLLASVECLKSETLQQLRQFASGSVRLAVTHHRAEAMGLMNGRRHVNMSLRLSGEINQDQILRLCSTSEKVDTKSFDLREASAQEVAGLTLARLGRLIPAIVGVPIDATQVPGFQGYLDSGAFLVVTTVQIDEMASNERVELIHVSDGTVPLEEAEDARFMFFREANCLLEHVAVLIGSPESWADPVPVRIHSACLTGDLFGSLRCDCGEQLRGSLRVFSNNGGGVLLYLAQEGRGIGLGNKLRAYGLQQEGLDTVDADGTLGFGADERRYDAAVEMLRQLHVDRVQLLTNNPEKVRALREAGIQVMDRQPLYGTLNRHNVLYVKAKVNRAGHWLGEMLSGAIPGK